ncbi:MAG: hypothetical protein LBG58_04700 [Planctomycetaceae bacterium]|jgi:hypothetical protein|nr:hypothetical protein [Planctomycetaceae bacterium]
MCYCCAVNDYFFNLSGTAVYRKTFKIPNDFFVTGQRIILDLGQVESLAEVVVNGKERGVLWTLEKSVDITDFINTDKENTLEIRVTNLWCNRLIGDAKLPQDKE